jgi:hypothetical protein
LIGVKTANRASIAFSNENDQHPHTRQISGSSTG